MRAFDAAWTLLKAIGRDQLYDESYESTGYGSSPQSYQRRFGVMHPAIRGLLERAYGRVDPKIGRMVEEVPKGMEQDRQHQPMSASHYPGFNQMETHMMENYELKPFDPSLTGSYDGKVLRNLTPMTSLDYRTE